MNDQPQRDESLRTLLAAPPRPRCSPARATARTLVGRDRRVVPVAALGRAA